MPLNKAFEGREFAAAPPYEVTAESIREFADSIGDPNPLYRDEAAAKEAGNEAIIAPPPNPMIARPVAIPGRSGNHLMSVETGEM
jgi:acyl dehydratase